MSANESRPLFHANGRGGLRREQARIHSGMLQPETGPEMRRWTRHKIDVRLRVSFPSSAGTEPVFGRGNNLSHGGMGAFIPCSIAVGTNVSLEVTFPYSPTEVKLEAVVRSCDGFRYGLEFVHLRTEVRDIIMKNCESAAGL